MLFDRKTPEEHEDLSRMGSQCDPVTSRTAPTLEPIRTYDAKQIEALLKDCAICGKPKYFTAHDATVCGGCQ